MTENLSGAGVGLGVAAGVARGLFPPGEAGDIVIIPQEHIVRAIATQTIIEKYFLYIMVSESKGRG